MGCKSTCFYKFRTATKMYLWKVSMGGMPIGQSTEMPQTRRATEITEHTARNVERYIRTHSLRPRQRIRRVYFKDFQWLCFSSRY